MTTPDLTEDDPPLFIKVGDALLSRIFAVAAVWASLSILAASTCSSLAHLSQII